MFTFLLSRYLDDAGYRELQLSLILHPDRGAVIPGTHGLRKVRWKGTHSGKRGGLRVIYYWVPRETTCLMLFIYRKTTQGDLTAAQAKQLARLVREEFG